MSPVLPGGTIGILGSGQLGRMLALVAKRLGYRVHVYSPDRQTPAGQVADVEIVADYGDSAALARFAHDVDVATIEFENIPVAALQMLEQQVPVYPQPNVLHIAQNRLREKTFLNELGVPVVPFVAVRTEGDLQPGIERLGLPLVLKTAGFGYDGKGQARINSLKEARNVFEQLGGQACVLERLVNLEREVSVIAARSDAGDFVAYAPVENRHERHILDVTLAPARLSDDLNRQAVEIIRQIMTALEMRGLLCVEFFISTEGELLVNELAPRPHNSGHYTIEAAVCSQFEQQLRSVCGLPLGDTTLLHAAAMGNLLGDCWQDGTPDWAACLGQPSVYLHLYGKREPRPGRKMGHLTALGQSPEEALSRLQAARSLL